VLTRRSAAIEALGAATVLCADKTGTLTMNRMTVAELRAGDQIFVVPETPENKLPEAFHQLVEFAILASERDPFDPMEKAFHALGVRYLSGTEHVHRDWLLVQDYGIRPELLAMAHVWRGGTAEAQIVAAKGAPEAIADLCHLDPAASAALRETVSEMAERGLRVLAVARAWFRGEAWPAGPHEFDFELLGLVGLADQMRPGVAAAVAACRDAGIRVVMITGDHPATARAIASDAGLSAADGVIDGPALAAMTEQTLRERLRHVSVFARIMPEQKLRLVEALKSAGEIVAMTGDGVNDAPALKSAHIGIAMGGRGTDVAREAAAIVLLDDDFASIVAAVRLGRRIFGNLQKAMAYIVAIHVPIAGLSVLPLVFGWPLVLAPAHIVFLELVIDPVCAVVFEAETEERDVMRRPPRDPRAPLFSLRLVAWSITQGLCVLAVVVFTLVVALDREMPTDEARALAFVTLVVANLALIFVNRSASEALSALFGRPNPALWLVVGVTAAVLTLIFSIPTLRALFGFGMLHAADFAACAAGSLATLVGLVVLRNIAFAKRAKP
jgi:Ca2+-transporting ATPase